MAIKRYTLTFIDVNGESGKATYFADDSGAHADALTIANAIAGTSNAGIKSLKASETVTITSTAPGGGSESVRKRAIVQYVIDASGMKSYLRVSVPDHDDSIVSAGSDIIRQVADPLSIYSALRSEEGNTPIDTIDWAKYQYKRPKL